MAKGFEKLRGVSALRLAIWAAASTWAGASLGAEPAAPPSGDKATYVGPAVCVTCHGGLTSTNRPADYQRKLVDKCLRSAHAGTAADVRKEPGRIVAPFGPESPIKRDDVAYAIGAGRGEQRYCTADFRLLPHRWNVKTGEWVDQRPLDAAGECMGCHATGYRAAERSWGALGVSCEACHGPGSKHVESAGKTRMLSLHSLDLHRRAMVCGQCHSDGTDPAKVHPFPVDFRPGDDLASVFLFAPKSGPGQKYTELMRSKHARMNVLCLDCHDPHGPVEGTQHQLVKPVIQLCQSCHSEKKMEKHAPQAAGDATCATCHMPDGSHRFRKAER